MVWIKKADTSLVSHLEEYYGEENIEEHEEYYDQETDLPRL